MAEVLTVEDLLVIGIHVGIMEHGHAVGAVVFRPVGPLVTVEPASHIDVIPEDIVQHVLNPLGFHRQSLCTVPV